MQIAILRFLLIGGAAAAMLATTPFATPAAATADDVLLYTVRSGDTLNRIAIQQRQAAGWFSQADCLTAIRQANGLQDSNLLRPGQVLRIPVHHEPDPPRALQPTRDGADLRGLYLPAAVCGFQSVFARIDSFTVAGGNGVVFDAKDIDGGISYRSAQPLAAWGKGRTAPVISDLPDLIERLHARDLWVVARLAIFLDGELGRQRPDLALADPGGEPWTERGCTWMDPADPTVREYNLQLALELANAGVDEVQLDYVRYPTNGWRGDHEGDLAATAAARRAVITSFVAMLQEALQAVDCVLSADLFGIMAWDRTEDLALTGQHVPSLAPHLDVICPMIYPSHFAPGFEGLESPGDHPEHLIAAGVRRFREQAGPGPLIRPWLQAFPWRVTGYDSAYVLAQIQAAEEAGAMGWSLWNPAGRYEVAHAAMRTPALVLASAAAAEAVDGSSAAGPPPSPHLVPQP